MNVVNIHELDSGRDKDALHHSSPQNYGADELCSLLPELMPISEGCSCPADLQGSNDLLG